MTSDQSFSCGQGKQIDRFIALPEVSRVVALQKTAIYARVRKGTFPRPVKLSSHAVRWIEREVQDWMGERQRTGENS